MVVLIMFYGGREMKTIKELVYYVLYAMFTMTFMWLLFSYGETTVESIREKFDDWRLEREVRKRDIQQKKLEEKLKRLETYRLIHEK